MKATEFIKNSQNGKGQTLVFIYGDETYLRDSALRAYVSKNMPDMPELNYHVLGEDTAVDSFIELCEQIPLFSDTRLIVLKNFALFSKGDAGKCIAYLKELPAYVRLAFVVTDALDKRRALAQYLLKNALTVEAQALSEKELIHWIIATAKASHVMIEQDAAALLLMTAGDDMQTLKNEIQKLIMLGGKNVTAAMVRDVSATTMEYNALLFHGYMIEGKTEEALSLLSQIQNDKTTAGKANFFGFLRLLATNFRLMYMAKSCLDMGYSPHEAAEQIAKQAHVKYYAGKMAAKNVRGFTIGEIKDAIKALEKLDYQLKYGQGTERLDAFFLTLYGKIK